MDKKTVMVSAALIVKDKRILAALRPENKKLGGYWELPGGKVEIGEDPADTCLREIREELNCDILVKGFVTRCTFEYPDFKLQMDIFECALAEGSFPCLMEHSALMWVDSRNIFTLDWVPADKEFLPLINEKFLL